MSSERINVTKSFLPPIAEYERYVEAVFKNCHLTNDGPLLKELENKLSDYLGVRNLQYVTNGTIALQLAIKALGIEDGEIITTPFSYVATTSSILWEKCKPVFVDIETDNFTIDANKIEQAITEKTRAIMPVHVFGYACNVDEIDRIAKKHNLKVIYDAAHAFGSKYKGKALVSYGDISTLSFHATKLFHTIEGGACIVKDDTVSHRLSLAKSFGHRGDTHFALGINGKQSEIHAAMGLANFPYINSIIAERKEISELYDEEFSGCSGIQRPKTQKDLEYNYAYFPIVVKSEQVLLRIFDELSKENIYPRRYFYPTLNKLPYFEGESCPISEDITLRIMCLPLFVGLDKDIVYKITKIIKESV